jgi:hypothetical protein
MKHTFGEYTVEAVEHTHGVEKATMVSVTTSNGSYINLHQDHKHVAPLLVAALAEVDSLKLKLEQAYDEADEQRFVLTAAQNHLFEMLLSGGGAVYDQARSYLKRHQPDLEARLETVKPPSDDGDGEDIHNVAWQMICFCGGFAAPDDIADIRAGLTELGMSIADADRVLWAMRNVRKDK